jgi:capsular exopolysaccharide synthesis family protein
VDLREIIAALRRRWWLLVTLPLIGAAAAVAITATSDPVYESSATAAVRVAPLGAEPSTEDIRASFQLAATYARLATTEPVLEHAAENLGRPGEGELLRDDVTASSDVDTQLIVVSARAGTAEEAQALADEVAEQARARVIELRVGGDLVVVAPAEPAEKVSPSPRSNLAIGVAVGLTLAVMLILLLEAMGSPVRDPEQLASLVGLDVLGSVRTFPRRAGPEASLAALLGHNGAGPAELPRGVLDDYLLLRARLEVAARDAAAAVILVTAPRRRAGASVTAANLALVLARGDLRVLLVDADLRSPAQHRLLGVPGDRGLSTALSGEALPASLVVHLGDGLAVLPAGAPSAAPAELLVHLGDCLGELRTQFDLILVDAPPLLDAADTRLIAHRVDAAVLVVDGARPRSASLLEARKALAATRTPVLGMVLNRVGGRRGRHPIFRRGTPAARAANGLERLR